MQNDNRYSGPLYSILSNDHCSKHGKLVITFNIYLHPISTLSYIQGKYKYDLDRDVENAHALEIEMSKKTRCFCLNRLKI